MAAPTATQRRVYVAGAFKDWQAVRAVQSAMRAAGHVITFDWTPWAAAIDASAAPPCAPRSFSVKGDEAALDLEGACSADAIVAVLTLPDHPYQGTMCEVTAGLALGRRVIAIDTIGEASKAAGCIMFYHGSIVRVSTTDAAVHAIAAIA